MWRQVQTEDALDARACSGLVVGSDLDHAVVDALPEVKWSASFCFAQPVFLVIVYLLLPGDQVDFQERDQLGLVDNFPVEVDKSEGSDADVVGHEGRQIEPSEECDKRQCQRAYDSKGKSTSRKEQGDLLCDERVPSLEEADNASDYESHVASSHAERRSVPQSRSVKALSFRSLDKANAVR